MIIDSCCRDIKPHSLPEDSKKSKFKSVSVKVFFLLLCKPFRLSLVAYGRQQEASKLHTRENRKSTCKRLDCNIKMGYGR